MKEELNITLPPRIRRVARSLGISEVIYGFLRLTFIGELVSSALVKRRRSSLEPTDEPILESE
jgi:hypothetical protein